MTKSIAYIGPHCSGKTTMVKQTEQVLKALGFTVYVTPENVRSCPFPINKEAGIEAQTWVYHDFIEQHERAWKSGAEYLIFDRCILDHIPYTMYQMHVRKKITVSDAKELISETIDKWFEYVDLLQKPILLYCSPLKLKVDGVRDAEDESYQSWINWQYRKLLDENKVNYVEVVR